MKTNIRSQSSQSAGFEPVDDRLALVIKIIDTDRSLSSCNLPFRSYCHYPAHAASEFLEFLALHGVDLIDIYEAFGLVVLSWRYACSKQHPRAVVITGSEFRRILRSLEWNLLRFGPVTTK